MVCSSVMDYRNLELLPQKEWGHVNPKLLKAWTESSLARNSSNIVSLPRHSWAIVSFKMWALPQGKRKHIRLYSAPPGVIQLHRKGEEGQRNGTQNFPSPWPSRRGRRAPWLLLWAKTTRVSWAFSESPHLCPNCCLLFLELLCGPSEACGALADPVCLSVCVCLSVLIRGRGQEQAPVLRHRWWTLQQCEEWCLTAPEFCASPWLCLSNMRPPTGPELSSAAQQWQETLSSGNSESSFQSLASYILFICPKAHLRDYLLCFIPSWIQLLIWYHRMKRRN